MEYNKSMYKSISILFIFTLIGSILALSNRPDISGPYIYSHSFTNDLELDLCTEKSNYVLKEMGFDYGLEMIKSGEGQGQSD